MRKIYTFILVFSCMPFFMGLTAAPGINADAKAVEDIFYSDASYIDDAMVAEEDTIIPAVLNITPVFNVNETAGTMTIVFTVTYSEEIMLADNYKFTVHANPGPGYTEIEQIADTGIVVEGNTLTLRPATVFSTTSMYEIVGTYGSVTDTAGNIASSLTHKFIYDQTPPQFVSITPDINQLQDLEVVFTLTYNEFVQLAPNHQILLYHFPPGQEKVEVEKFDASTITVAENTITLDPSIELQPVSTYEIVITAGSVMDMAGNLATSFTRTFSTIDNTFPTVVERSAAFSTSGRLVLLFSKPVNINGTQATIRRQSNNEVVATVPVQKDGERQLSLVYDITQLTDDNEKFVVEIDGAAISDLTGNQWAGFGADAWVVSLPDRVAPELLTVEPNLDEPVARNAVFTFTFSESIKLASSYAIEVKFYQDDGGPYNNNNWVISEVFNEGSITISGNKMIIDPVKIFDVTVDQNRAEYQMIISAGSITDLAGNNFVYGERTSYSKIFNVNEEFISLVTFNPMDGDTLDYFPEELTITFSQEILLSDSTAVDQAALESLVYLNKGGQDVAYTVSITDFRIVRIELDATEVPDYGTQYTYGFLAGFIDSAGVAFEPKEVSFTLRDINATIAEVRGEGEVSPLDGETVRITGTVTAIFAGEGFFVQDANTARSGIWVAYAQTDTLETGGGVIVVGEVAELAQVTSIVAERVWLTDAPLAVQPLVINWATDSIAMYESMLVQVTTGRASAANQQGTWTLYFDESTDSLLVGNRILVYAPVESNVYNITGVVSNRGGVYRLQPRLEADVVDVTEPTSVHIPAGTEFTIYPNPFSNVVRISNYDKLSRVIIANITGQQVVDMKYPGSEINTSRLISGVYIISLFDEQGLVKTSRIVKR